MKTKTRERKDPLGNELFQSIFTAGELGLIGSIFRRMEIAEEEITSAKRKFPLLASKLHDAFRCLCPTTPLQHLSDAVYRHHCRELLERIANGADLKPGTAAEVLAMLAEASVLAPPTRTSVVLYWHLFQRVLPAQAGRVADDIAPLLEDSYHEQQALELEAKLRRKLACDRAL